MNLAVLFSGGKDSTFAIHEVRKTGHTVKCLITILTHSADSHLLHHPNIKATSLQARAMKIPQILIESDTADTEKEIDLIKTALVKSKSEYNVAGVVHGGILSEFQKTQFDDVVKSLGLHIISPLWKRDERQYMCDLLDCGFEFIITSVSSAGLDESWLGKKLTKQDLDTLILLSEKYGFNLSFEGGEAETFVTNCPLFSHPITITESKIHWDGYRGRFEIVHSKIQGNA